MRLDHLSQMLFSSLALVAGLLCWQPLGAQGFDSGSDGSDGALLLNEPGTFDFDPRAFAPPLDADGDNIFHFTTIHIASGVTVRLGANNFAPGPVFWLASGSVQIDGTIDASGEAGHGINVTVLSELSPARPGPGGYPGGVGETPTSAAQPGTGPGGGGTGANSQFQHGGGGAGYASQGSGNAGQAYGNPFLVPLLGGSGGGGATYSSGSSGGGGGAGGGALLIASSQSITLGGGGFLLADGGAGGGASIADTRFVGGGGGGSGGALHLIAPIVDGTGQLRARGGTANFNGGSGSHGRVRIDAFDQAFTGGSIPAATFGSPFLILPTDVPTVRVTRVGGVDVPANPTGDFQFPDVTLMDAAAVAVEIEARNVPIDTVVKVHLFSENAADQIVDSSPLEGTLELSTATATVQIPPGFSRSFVRVTFDP